MRTNVIACLGALVAGGGWLVESRAEPAAPTGARVPVVVELFSSEGCSSCPPADAYVAALDRTQPIDGVTVIALEEHVDYWDRLGWRDPFASPAFSERQRDYARVLSDHHVFTPEIVVDGRLVMPGGDEEAARAMMQRSAREPKATLSLRREGGTLRVEVRDAPAGAADDPAEVWLAVTESGLATDVGAGENAGRRLAHAPVVRRLQSLGRAVGGAFHAETALAGDPPGKGGPMRVVVFVQLARSRAIVGAAVL